MNGPMVAVYPKGTCSTVLPLWQFNWQPANLKMPRQPDSTINRLSETTDNRLSETTLKQHMHNNKHNPDTQQIVQLVETSVK